MQDRLLSPGGFLEGQERPTGQRPMREDQCGIRIADIERGTDGGVGGIGLKEAEVMLRNASVLSEAAFGNPPAGL